jgi:L-ascorbate metabolism protein UlaG (beta-lactamase superfamily)
MKRSVANPPGRTHWCLAAILALWPPAHAHEPGEAHYVGNEGVLVRHGDSGALFDALFLESLGNYAVPDADARAAMDAGRPPFDAVDGVFVSHVHADHLDASRMLEYLLARPSVRAFGPLALRDAVAAAGAEQDVLDRIVVFDVQPGTPPQTHALEGLLVEVVAVPHANPQRFDGLQNLVFRVVLDETLTVMHLGDADMDPAPFAAQRDHWAARPVHGVFPPWWFLASPAGRAILEREIGADTVIGIHVPRTADREPDRFRARLGGDAFVVPGELRPLPHDRDGAPGLPVAP